MSLTEEAGARAAARAWGLGEAPLTVVTAGHINRTYLLGSGAGRRVLQRLNPIFAPEVHHDIEAVTAHLERKGVATPRLVRTEAGELWRRDAEGGIWRLFTYVDGVTHARADAPEICRTAGALVGRFHVAVADLRHEFRHRRPSLHDTARHLAHLREVVTTRRDHPSHAAVAALGRDLAELASGLPSLDGAPRRITHNDLKITNLVFSPRGEAIALIDLDTFALMSVPIELGDALRSWCNAAAEDAGEAEIDTSYFGAALEGYGGAARQLLSRVDRELLPHALPTIALELAARFAADALEESYFGWDKTRFLRAAEHNLLRARTQLSLGRHAIAERDTLTRLVQRHLG